jgi:integrase
VVYALELLAGVRPGEAAALRWRHDDPTIRPLGKLLVAKSYNAQEPREVEKTDAAMLAEWKLGGWGRDDGAHADAG